MRISCVTSNLRFNRNLRPLKGPVLGTEEGAPRLILRRIAAYGRGRRATAAQMPINIFYRRTLDMLVETDNHPRCACEVAPAICAAGLGWLAEAR